MKVMQQLRSAWCDLAHGGGRVLRDPQGRINWQCDKCGRWADQPVPVDVEHRVIEAAQANAEGR